MSGATASPRKSLSVREGSDGIRSLHAKVEKNRYKPIANFYFTIHALVKCPITYAKFNGFILNVHRTDGVSMKCYVLCDELDSAKKFKAALNRTFSGKGGVFWQGCSDEQFSCYVMSMLEEFMRNNGSTLRGTLVIGRQSNFQLVDDDGEFTDSGTSASDIIEEDDPRKKRDDFDSSIYVLNDSTQIDKNGVIPEEEWKYIWMVPYFRLIPAAQTDKFVKHFLSSHARQVLLTLPLRRFDWHDFVGEAKTFFGRNFMPFLFFLSGGIAAFHYKRILSTCTGCCPVATAVGDTASGKSTALKVISNLMGMQMVSQSSGEFVVSDLTRSSIPLSWDDPTFPSVLRAPLVSVFEGIGNQTQMRGCEKPLTSFLLTVNFKMDDDLRSFERTTPIWFKKLLNNNSRESFLERRQKIIDAASTHSLVDIIKMGEALNSFNLACHITFFKEKLSELSPRLADIYAIYRLLVHEIIDIVSDAEIVSQEDADDYLKKEFLPYVKAIYNERKDSSSSFFAEDGKTYFGNKASLFGDFTLKIVGELKQKKKKVPGHFVLSCGTMKRDKLLSKTIVMSVNNFDSKQRFIESLRTSYGSGAFYLGRKVTSAIVLSYYTSLKYDYDEVESREFYEPDCMGHQGDNYWIISAEMHVNNGHVIPESDHSYVIPNEYLLPYELEMEERLLNPHHLKAALRRFFSMSIGFGQNTVPFQMASAFTSARIVRNALAQSDVWTESNVGMIFSEKKCVGKSLSLFLLALGQGISSRVHMMFLSGGNQIMCGTSTKKIQESLSRTTGVVMIDDPTISKIFCEFLLQVQGGLLAGSSSEGMSAPKAAVLMTSNSEELQRLIGRVIRFNYTGPVPDLPTHDNELLYDRLLPFMEENKGIFLAWSIWILDFWKKMGKGYVQDIERVFKGCMAGIFVEQDRWIKGLAIVAFADSLLRLTHGGEASLVHTVRYFLHQTIVQQKKSMISVMEKLEKNIQTKLETSTDHVLGWLNLSVTVKDIHGIKRKAYGVMQSVVDNFTDISHAEFQEEYSRIVENVQPIGIYFAKTKETTRTDLSRRQNAFQKRAYRFPVDSFTEYTKQCIHYACGLQLDKPEKEDECEQDALGDFEISIDQESVLLELDSKIKEDFQEWERSSLDRQDNTEEDIIEDVREILSPKTKKIYSNWTPKKRKAFNMGLNHGIELCNKRGKITDDSSLADCNRAEDMHNDQTPPQKDSNAKAACPKKLFVDGAVGVFARTVYGFEKHGEAPNTKDQGEPSGLGTLPYIYCICKEEKDEEDEDMMIVCETRNVKECPGSGFYHLGCINMKSIPKGKWICEHCKAKKRKSK